ncbi:hypothetical protein FGIG_01138 [Fasciola gigantica]|uniref:EGF-like domain-containing protein n=1 Tax=Fasciola gigantica TaxID=46835 RepID=A0A504YNQ5_FASGI|nr:hypothetical protein FGIG_01138 [Fasciola gigantica]
MIRFFYFAIYTVTFAVVIIFGISEAARANVTLRMSLTHDIHPGCDETVYKVVVCAGEFTNECELLPSATRFIQAACAAQSTPEPLTFSVNSVENPIELDVTVTRVGEGPPMRLRRTEFLLTEGGEVSVTSMDLTMIVRFQVDYFCLPNYFGKLCDKFCDTKAEEHICDEWGNPICRSGYFLDPKSGECRQDQCVSLPNFCFNGGTCVNSPEPDAKPRCLCQSNFGGRQCEIEHISTVSTTTTATTERASSSLTTTMSHKSMWIDKLGKELMDHVPDATKSKNHLVSHPYKTASTTTAPDHFVTGKEFDLQIGVNNPRQEHSGKAASDVYYKATSGEHSRYREILIPAVVITLVLALLTVCVGFIAWVWNRKDRRKKRPNKLVWDDQCGNSLTSQPKRWASVDQSPSRLYTFEDQKVSSPGCLPSLNGTQFTNFGDSVDREPNYGGSLNTTFIPPRYSALDGYSNRVDGLWTNEANRFATLPRHCGIRRVTSELGGRPDTLPIAYTQYGNLPRLNTNSVGLPVSDALIDHYLRPSALIGTCFTEPSNPPFLSPIMSPITGEGLNKVYPSICSRAPSMNGACCLNSFEPLTNSVIYGSIPVVRDSLQTLIPAKDFISNPTDVINTGLTTAMPERPLVDVSHPSTFTTIPPPPPSEFADTFLKSEC